MRIYTTLIIGQRWTGYAYQYNVLRFATVGGVYDGDYYDARIKDLPILTVFPVDGGILPMYSDWGDIGDLSLINADFALNSIIDYGSYTGSISYIDSSDPNTLHYMFGFSVDRIAESGQEIVLRLRSSTQSFNDAYKLSVYAGTNALPLGLEGEAGDIEGNLKPQVLGMCKNITPVLVNESLLIYQASSRSDCVITAVYDDGVKLQDYQISHTGGYAAGSTSLAIAKGHGGLLTNTVIAFDNHPYTYTVTSGISGSSGTITIVNNYDGGGLYAAVVDRAGIAVVGFYTSTSALQSYDYFVNGKQIVGTKSLPLITGSGTISAGDKVSFSGHNTIYTVATGINSPGTLVLTKGISVEVQDGELVHKVGGSVPWLWGSYQGYFRLTGKPKGLITCDAMSLTGNLAHKPGDIINLIGQAAVAINPLDTSVKNTLNGTNYIGLYINDESTYLDLIKSVCLSIGSYFYVAFGQLQAGLVSAPTTGTYSINDYQIVDIKRNSIALTDSGIPYYRIMVNYDKIETVQDTVAGSVGSIRRQYVKKQYRSKKQEDSNVTLTHKSATQLTINSLLRRVQEVTTMLTRLMNLLSVRRDDVTVTIPESEFDFTWTYAIGTCFTITTPRLGYNSGRDMVFCGYTLDITNHVVSMRFYG